MRLVFYVTAFILIVPFLTSCGGEFNKKITAQDYEFIAKIKDHLKKKGDVIKVENVFPGEWTRVCINPIGMYSNIEVTFVEGEGLRSNGIEIINGADTYSNDYVWGIYFLYPSNKAEYYRITKNEMTGHLANIDDFCVDKRLAYLEVTEDISAWDNRNQLINTSGDFVVLKLKAKGEE